MPVKGFVVWDSHAFNLTQGDTSVEQWMNLEFAAAEESVYPRKQIFDADDLFGMGRIEAFSSKETCGTFTIPQHGQLLTLSSHTHRFGKQFRIWYPPNDICSAEDPDCLPNEREPEYTSFDYADPLYQRFVDDEILSFESDAEEERTFKYCALYDNGESDSSGSSPGVDSNRTLRLAISLTPSPRSPGPSASTSQPVAVFLRNAPALAVPTRVWLAMAMTRCAVTGAFATPARPPVVSRPKRKCFSF